jgi:hypothetical protein
MQQFLFVLATCAMELMGRFRRWLTFRRVLGIVALLVLVLCLKGIIFDLGMGADLPLLFGLDWGLAIEVSALLIALSVRDRVTTVAYVARRWLLQAKPASRLLRRSIRRAVRSRLSAQHLPPPPDDRPGQWAFA